MGINTILLIEDNPGDVLLVKSIIHSLGIIEKLVHFKNGEDATAYLAKNTNIPALILLDKHLPGMDGLEIITKLRMHSHLSNTKVALFSSQYNPEDEEFKNIGYDKAFEKPFRYEEYYDIIKNLCTEWLKKNTD